MKSSRQKSNAVFVDRKLLSSGAFWALRVHSAKVLMRFFTKRVMSKHKDSKGNVLFRVENNGKLVFTYDEAGRKGLSKKQFSAAIDDLIATGFIEVTKQGTGPGDPSTYRLSERWQAWGTAKFEPGKPRRKNLDPNWGWNVYNKREKLDSTCGNAHKI